MLGYQTGLHTNAYSLLIPVLSFCEDINHVNVMAFISLGVLFPFFVLCPKLIFYFFHHLFQYSFTPQYTFILSPYFSFGKIFLSFVAASIVHLSTRTVWLIFLKATILALLYFALVVTDQLLFFCSFGDIILRSLFNLLWNVPVHLCTVLNSWKNLF